MGVSSGQWHDVDHITVQNDVTISRQKMNQQRDDFLILILKKSQNVFLLFLSYDSKLSIFGFRDWTSILRKVIFGSGNLCWAVFCSSLTFYRIMKIITCLWFVSQPHVHTFLVWSLWLSLHPNYSNQNPIHLVHK